MIRAEEAKKLSEESEAHVDKALEAIDKLVKTAAGRGVRHVFLKGYDKDIFEVIKPPYYPPEMKPLMHRTAERLKSLGYTVDIEAYEARAIDHSDGADLGATIPTTCYHIKVGW